MYFIHTSYHNTVHNICKTAIFFVSFFDCHPMQQNSSCPAAARGQHHTPGVSTLCPLVGFGFDWGNVSQLLWPAWTVACSTDISDRHMEMTSAWLCSAVSRDQQSAPPHESSMCLNVTWLWLIQLPTVEKEVRHLLILLCSLKESWMWGRCEAPSVPLLSCPPPANQRKSLLREMWGWGILCLCLSVSFHWTPRLEQCSV